MLDVSVHDGYFGLTAEVWVGSTSLSLRQLFGDASTMFTSPDDGPEWVNGELAAPWHFINCHGAALLPCFLGQRGPRDYPFSLDARTLPALTPGTVAAAECCFGAQLYDPARSTLSPPAAGLANTYLGNGALGFFGSTNTAYGPADANGQADLITRFFLASLRSGASLGRAALEARQRFVRESSLVDPTDAKTLLQFVLLGDPSLHAVSVPPASTPGPGAKNLLLSEPHGDDRIERVQRRENLAMESISLRQGTSFALEPETEGDKGPGPEELLALAGVEPGDRVSSASFVVRPAPNLSSVKSFALAAVPVAVSVEVVISSMEAPDDEPWLASARTTAVVAQKAADGTTISWRTLHSR